MSKAGDALPSSLPPRGLSREVAAAYIGVSPPTFDSLVREGKMPRPFEIGTRRIWDRVEIDVAFAALPRREESSNLPKLETRKPDVFDRVGS
jgi:predicted DNA-binding transcriptional regulator AlpA